MAFNMKYDVTLNAIIREINHRYGEGETYKNFDHVRCMETFVHWSRDRIKRTFEIDKYALERGGRDPIILIEEDHSQKIPDYVSPASMVYENSYNMGWGEPAIPSQSGIEKNKKRNEQKGDIRKLLQKETDEWLKSI